MTHTASHSTGDEERPIRVVLAEDHSLMRTGLRFLLDGEKSVDVVAEAADLGSATRAINDYHPDVLVLDLHMTNRDSAEAIARLRHSLPATQIVALTMDQSPGVARRALEAGAQACILKDRADSDLSDAIRQAYAGNAGVAATIV